jgi:hypothetical protein
VYENFPEFVFAFIGEKFEIIVRFDFSDALVENVLVERRILEMHETKIVVDKLFSAIVKSLGPLFWLEMNLLNTISFKKVIERFRNAKSSDETRHMRKAERRNHFSRHCMRKVIKKVHFNFSKVETNKSI